jgi:DeoR family suf operon transcriptional repressor
VRQQITSLVAEGYVRQEVERNGRGRPRHVYSLTTSGRALFPHHYDEFTNGLLREIVISEGPQKVEELLGRIGRRLAAQYEGELAGLATIERTARLTELLNAKGILAEMRLQPDGIEFHEYTCHTTNWPGNTEQSATWKGDRTGGKTTCGACGGR